jgi:hypothetical protein
MNRYHDSANNAGLWGTTPLLVPPIPATSAESGVSQLLLLLDALILQQRLKLLRNNLFGRNLKVSRSVIQCLLRLLWLGRSEQISLIASGPNWLHLLVL